MKRLLVYAGMATLCSLPWSVSAQPAMPESPPLPAAACVVEPRTLDSLKTLSGDESATPELDYTDEPVEADLPQGPVVSVEIVAAVTAVETEYIACLNAGDYPRALALLTDGATRDVLMGLDQDPAAWFVVPVTPGAEASEVNVLTVRDVRELGPDRVGAIVWWGTPGNTQYPEETLFHEFVLVDGQWLLDEETTAYYP